MKKNVIIPIMLLFCLTGCSISTPQGTVSLTYDSTQKTDNVVYTDDNGKSTVIHMESAKAYVDQFLDGVVLPHGATTDELKTFVYSNLDSLGINLDEIDLNSPEEVEKAESSIKDSLEEQGIDTSDMDIDLSQLQEESNE